MAAVPTRALLYHVSVQTLAERVLSHIRRQEFLKAGDRVGVAVSSGIDSVALLRLLLQLRGELGIVLSVVHFNHKLRGEESDADERFVADLARAHDLDFHVDSCDVAQHAADERISVETAARDLRYGFFRHLLGEDGEGYPQGLKPSSFSAADGTAEGVPLPSASEGQIGSAKASGKDGQVKTPTLSLQPTPGQGRGTRSVHLDKILTGHTLDDQAETVLMRLIRGAGLRGLGGIHPRIFVEGDNGEVCGEIFRPLLGIRRSELEKYLNEVGQPWREDSTNADHAFTRNRLRQLVVPLLEKEFNPAVADNLSELAEIARGEEDYWENEISGWMGTVVHWSEPDWARAGSGLVQITTPGIAPTPSISSKERTSRARSAREMGHPPPPDDSISINRETDDLQSSIDQAPWLVMNASVSRMWFLGEPVAVQRRLVKAIGEEAGIPLEFKHVEEVLRLAAEDGPKKEISLAQGWKAVREQEELRFITPDLREELPPSDYEYSLSVPGCIAVYETRYTMEAWRIPADAAARYNPDELLDADSVTGPFVVRNWRAGDRFWPAHTKSPKKIKELLQERHVTQPERGLWPVVLSDDKIVWVRGLATPAKFRRKPGRDAILIAERPLTEREST